MLVGLRRGRVVAVQGDPASGVSRGLLCAKGYHAGALLYGKDRLTQPHIRKNGRLVPASWDEAIDLIADKIIADPNARLCMASAVVGFLTTFGVDEPSGCYDDIDECDTVITWAEMHPVQGQ